MYIPNGLNEIPNRNVGDFVSKDLSLRHDFDRTKELLINKITKTCLENGI